MFLIITVDFVLAQRNVITQFFFFVPCIVIQLCNVNQENIQYFKFNIHGSVHRSTTQ